MALKSGIRLAVIGVGQHVRRRLLPTIQAVDGLKIELICSRSIDRARCEAERQGAAYYTDDWVSAIDANKVDAVVVAGPPAFHFDVASPINTLTAESAV